MNSKHNLLPCPCCGGQAQVCKSIRTYFDFYIVECNECGLRTADCNTADVAVEKWNKRKDKKDMKEITRITTVELTEIMKVEDETMIKSKEQCENDLKEGYSKLGIYDNVNITNVQDFVREVE